jgi:hypothetical protein
MQREMKQENQQDLPQFETLYIYIVSTQMLKAEVNNSCCNWMV